MTNRNERVRKSAVHKKLRRRKFFTGLFVILSLAIICLFTPLFDVSEVSVSGCKVLDPQKVIDASGIKKGDNFLFVDTDDSEEAINALGYVDKVKVKRKFFTRIEIDVTEASAIAYIDFSGSYVGVDKDFKILSVDKKGKLKPGRAVITGIALKNVTKGQVAKPKDEKRFSEISKLMDALMKKGIMPRVKKIDLSKKGELSFTLDSDTKVYFGNSSDMDYRMEFVKEILSKQTNLKGGILDISDTTNVIYHPPAEGAKK